MCVVYISTNQQPRSKQGAHPSSINLIPTSSTMVSTVTTHRTPEGFTGAPAQPSKKITIVKLGANSAPGVTVPTSSTLDTGVK